MNHGDQFAERHLAIYTYTYWWYYLRRESAIVEHVVFLVFGCVLLLNLSYRTVDAASPHVVQYC